MSLGRVADVTPKRFSISISSQTGQSGSPIWIPDGDRQRLTGILSTGGLSDTTSTQASEVRTTGVPDHRSAARGGQNVDAAGRRRSEILSELSELLRFPTVSAGSGRSAAFAACAAWLARHMRAIGLTAEVLPTCGQPIVIGESQRHPDRPTVLIYGHYDVQPPDPLHEWTTPPFEPAVHGEYLYARGASDDKGQFFAHLKAVEQHVRAGTDLPVNVRFLFEGEEEIGSPNLPHFLEQHRDRVAADVAVVSDTRMLGPDRPAITYSLRGSLAIEIEVTGPARDLHSGNFGGAVLNPLHGLCELLSQLHDRDGRIAIPGFYARVRPVDGSERKYLAQTGPSDTDVIASAGARAGWGERGFTASERTTIRPALIVTGMAGGYRGPGVKGVLPARATAKVNVRLVPDQDPQEIDALLRRHLAAAAPPALSVRVTTHAQARPVVVSVHHPGIRAASVAYRRAFGRAPVFVRSGGTIPVVDQFQRLLHIPTVLMGFALPGDGLHGPDERLHVPTFFKGVTTSAHFLSELRFEAAPPPARTQVHHDHRLPLPRRKRRRPDRTLGHERAPGGHAPAQGRPEFPRRPLPRVSFRLRRCQPADCPDRDAASRSILRFAFVNAERDRGRIASLVREAVEDYGFLGIKVHRYDARISREVCEAGRRFRGCRSSMT